MTKFHVTEHAVVDAPVERVWEVVSRTDRYAEWVAGAIEVTDHHGIATVGRTYAERNRTLGPLRTDSVWTVVEIDPLRRRVDTGVGFAPLKEVTSIFEFEPVRGADGREATRMTYRWSTSSVSAPSGCCSTGYSSRACARTCAPRWPA
jgi:hypothetical protein